MPIKIPVENRVSTYPGRVTLTPVSGQANTYDMVRADMPLTEGTPINKALLDNKAYTLTEDVTLYVANNGDDVSGDGTATAPFATIQRAIDELPKHLGGHTATIDIAAGTYEERVKIVGYSAGSIIVGLFGRTVTVRGMEIVNSSHIEVNIRNITKAAGFDGTMFVASKGSEVYVANSMNIDCGSTNANGMQASEGSKIYFTNGLTLDVKNSGGSAVTAVGGSTVALSKLTGAENLFGIGASYGGIVSYDTNTLVSGLGDAAFGGGLVIAAGGWAYLYDASVV